jgi:hypothetical protein
MKDSKYDFKFELKKKEKLHGGKFVIPAFCFEIE